MWCREEGDVWCREEGDVWCIEEGDVWYQPVGTKLPPVIWYVKMIDL